MYERLWPKVGGLTENLTLGWGVGEIRVPIKWSFLSSWLCMQSLLSAPHNARDYSPALISAWILKH